MDQKKVTALRMERQFLSRRANEEEYIELYRDTQPGQSVYWNGFGQPPVLSFRAKFDDAAFNRDRQLKRELVKGRFSGGNLGWIVFEDMELFRALYRKPLERPTELQEGLYRLIEREGPLTIQQIKEETGLLVKEITPVLHRLQEAFLIYEDQYNGEWDRGWMRFEEMFPQSAEFWLSRHEALKRVLLRFAYRMVVFTTGMAKAFYRLPEKDIRRALADLTAEGVLKETGGEYFLPEDEMLLQRYSPAPPRFVYAIHRNDMLYKCVEDELKKKFLPLSEDLPYDHEPLQYLLIDGEFHGASVGHFRNGPYDLNDVICDLPDPEERREEILNAVAEANFGRLPKRFLGKDLPKYSGFSTTNY